MDRHRAAAAAVLLFVIHPPARARTDPLWEKAVAQAALAGQWAPAVMELTAERVRGGQRERSRVRQRLTGWRQGKPVYASIQVEPLLEPGQQARGGFDMAVVATVADELLKPGTPVRRLDHQTVNGKKATLFEAGQPDGPANAKLKLWVDPASGVAHQLETTMHGPLTVEARMLTVYKPHPQAGSLPQRFDLRMNVLVPFAGAQINVVGDMDGWVRRPAETGQSAAAILRTD